MRSNPQRAAIIRRLQDFPKRKLYVKGTSRRPIPYENAVNSRSKIWKIAKRALLSVSVLTVVLLGGGLAYRTYRHYQLATATLIDPVKGIDEAFFTKIGGID